MQYKNKSGRSGISHYSYDEDGINVTFKNGGEYRYSVEDNGDYMISRMRAMGDNGEYLNRLINAEKPSYVGQSVSPGVIGDIRKLMSSDEKNMRNVHNKYVYREPNLKKAIENAVRKKMSNVGSYKEWSKFR